MFSYAQNPQSIWKMYRDGFHLYKMSFSKSWLLVLIMLILNSASSLLTLFFSSQINDLFLFLSRIFLGLMMVTILGVTYNRINEIAIQGDSSFSHSCKRVIKNFWPLVFLPLFLGTIFYVGLCIPYFFMDIPVNSIWVYLNFTGFRELFSYSHFQIFITIWALLFLYVVVCFYFYIFFILFENGGVFKSLKESVKLVIGNWWRTFVVILGALLIIILFMFLIAIFEVILLILLGMFFDEFSLIWIFTAGSLIVGLSACFSLPFFLSVVLVLYRDLKAIRLKATEKSRQVIEC